MNDAVHHTKITHIIHLDRSAPLPEQRQAGGLCEGARDGGDRVQSFRRASTTLVSDATFSCAHTVLPMIYNVIRMKLSQKPPTIKVPLHLSWVKLIFLQIAICKL